MKVIKQAEVNSHKNADTCVAHEYPFGHPDINLAVIDITGRYPTSGYVVNEVCVEIAHVVKGSATVTFQSGEQAELEVGDAILLDKGELYYWNGECQICVPCTPA